MYNLIGSEFIRTMCNINNGIKPTSGKDELVMRCPYCGDSIKNSNSTHMYISVPKNENDLSFYNCKLCNASGIVGNKFLTDIGCGDSNAMVEITRHNNELLKMPKYKLLKNIDIYPLNYNTVTDSPRSRSKLQYINNRIGANFTYMDLANLKITLNVLTDIIEPNRLEYTRAESVVKALDSFFIGFISYDNSYCALRKVSNAVLDSTVNKRYINYNLVKKDDRTKNHYVIPTSIDVTSPQPVRIHIAEGAFDVLSIYYNLNNRNNMQNIYVAAGGKSYMQTLEFILTDLGVINYEVHLYPDKDVTDYEFKPIVNRMKDLPVDIYVHRNIMNGEKDFGVPMSRINDGVMKVDKKKVENETRNMYQYSYN